MLGIKCFAEIHIHYWTDVFVFIGTFSKFFKYHIVNSRKNILLGRTSAVQRIEREFCTENIVVRFRVVETDFCQLLFVRVWTVLTCLLFLICFTSYGISHIFIQYAFVVIAVVDIVCYPKL